MRKLFRFALGGIATAALAGTAVAAVGATHLIRVALPDGSVANVEYAGDVPPRVVVAPAPPMIAVPVAVADPFAVFEQMDREMAAAMDQMRALASGAAGPAGPGASLAAYGGLPAQGTSYSSVTVVENGRACSRSTEVVGQGPGKPPKVLSKVSGDCGPAAAAPAAPAAPAPVVPEGPVHQS